MEKKPLNILVPKDLLIQFRLKCHGEYKNATQVMVDMMLAYVREREEAKKP